MGSRREGQERAKSVRDEGARFGAMVVVHLELPLLVVVVARC